MNTLGNHNIKSPRPVRVTRGTALRGLRNLQYQHILNITDFIKEAKCKIMIKRHYQM